MIKIPIHSKTLQKIEKQDMTVFTQVFVREKEICLRKYYGLMSLEVSPKIGNLGDVWITMDTVY